MPAKFTLRPEAEDDLENIWDYTAEVWNPEQANDYTKLLFSRFHSLAKRPATARSAEHVLPDMRASPCGSHVIYFIKTAYGIDIVRILHQSQDVKTQLNQSW
ncbi:MAG: type II toxin-antitoxin system RelE/ParE family toxin [Pseudomonadota bacterium]